VDDADTTTTAVARLGGTVTTGPEDAGPGGRTAGCADPAGAASRLWQPRRRLGAQRVNVPGTWNSSDLHTPDRDAATAFYGPLFGWIVVDMAQGAGTMIQVPGYGDHLAATVDPGIHERQASAPEEFADVIGSLVVVPAGEPARWHVTFTVPTGTTASPPPSGSVRPSSPRATTSGRSTRCCGTRRAPGSPSASSRHPAASGDASHRDESGVTGRDAPARVTDRPHT
jgi:predicted enzyme related to lactoylglutathione lyase